MMKITRMLRSTLTAFMLALGVSTIQARAATAADAVVTFKGIIGSPQKRAVYTVSEHPSLGFRIQRAGTDWDKESSCTVEIDDMWDHAVYRSQVPLQILDSNADLVITPNLTRMGWYYVKLDVVSKGTHLTVKRAVTTAEVIAKKGITAFPYPMFAIVPPATRAAAPGAPIGIDMALSTATSDKEEQIELASLSGVRWVRDRMSWPIFEPAPNQYNVEAYKDILGKLWRSGINTLMVFQSAPRWAKASDSLTFPNDLRDGYRFARAVGARLSPEVSAWEVWNEHDIAAFNHEPPDQYAATLKAIALGFKSLDTPPTVLLGPFARDPNVGDYGEILFENGVGPYLDAYSFHTYAPAGTPLFEKVLDTQLKMMKTAGLTIQKPWLSETGFAFKRDIPPSLREARDKQLSQMLWALPEAMQKGVGKVFWFLLRTYYGSDVEFGTVDDNNEPFPVYAAFAVINSELSDCTFSGSLAVDKTQVLIFNHGRDFRAMVMSREKETAISSSVLTSGSSLVDVMGNALEIRTRKGKQIVENDGWPFYINEAAGTVPFPQPSNASPKAPAPSKIIVRAVFPESYIAKDETEVMQNWDGMASKWAPRGYGYKRGISFVAKVEVYNFGNDDFSGSVEALLPAYVVSDLRNQSVHVAAGDRLELPVSIEPGVAMNGTQRWVFRLKDSTGNVVDSSVSKWSLSDK